MNHTSLPVDEDAPSNIATNLFKQSKDIVYKYNPG